MPRIPDFASLRLDDPSASGVRPQYPSTDPVAEAQEKFGAGLQKAGTAASAIGADMEDKRQKLNEATATTDFVNRLIPLHTEISTETDPGKILEKKQQYNALLQTSAQAIDDPLRQKQWVASHSRTLLQAQADADERLALIKRQNYGVSLERQLDGLIDNATKSPDAKALDIARLTGKSLIDAASGAGLSPQWVYEREKQFNAKLETATTQALGEAAANYALGLGPAPAAPKAPAGKSSNAVERFLDLAEEKESGGRNIEQQVVGPSGGYNPSVGRVTGPSTASGHFQITDTTWSEFALQAGVDLSKYPRAISAPYEVQRQVARTIATTSGVQHWTNYNKGLRSAASAEGLPVSGPITGGDQQPGLQAASIAADTPPAQGTDTGTETPPPGAQGGGPQQNRTGLPGLSEQLDRIQRLPIPDAAKEIAWRRAKDKYTAMEADAARSARLAAQAETQRVEQRTNEIYADAFSGNPQITAQQIAIDPAFNNNEPRRRQMIELVQRQAEGGRVDPGLSHKTEMELMSDIAAGKITDRTPIIEAYNAGKLNNAGFSFVTRQLDDIRTPQGERLAKLTDELVKSLASQIDHSNPLMGKMDFSGKTQLGVFAYDLRREVEAAREAGKTPAEIAQTILNPHRYVDHPELLAPYLKPLQQSLREQVRALREQSGTAGLPNGTPAAPIMKPNPLAAPVNNAPVATAPIPPAAVPPRQPGETPGDYLKRIGAGLPTR